MAQDVEPLPCMSRRSPTDNPLHCDAQDCDASLVARVCAPFGVIHASCGWGRLMQAPCGGNHAQEGDALACVAAVLSPVRHLVMEVFITRRRRRFEWKTMTAAGERSLSTEAIPELEPDGSVRHVLVLSIDKTEGEARDALLAESTERFRVLSDLSADWYWEQDAEFRFIYPPDGSICGRSGQSIIGKRRWDLDLRGVDDREWDAHRRILAAHQPFRDFVYGVVVNGSERTVSISGTPMFDRDGRFKGYRGVGREITRADLLREALDLTEKRLRMAVESGRIGIWERDVRGGKIYWSPNIAPMLGLPEGLVVVDYETFFARIHPEDDYYHHLRRHGVNMEAFDVEHRVIWPDGTVRWVHQRGDVMRGPDGRPSRVIGIIEDITRWKDEEERRLHDAVRQRDALIREVHHRIKNSLQGIALLLRQRATDASQQSSIEEVIGQIQTIAVMHGLQATQSPTPVTLSGILRAIVDRLRVSSPMQIIFEDACAGEIVEVAEGERVALALVLNELVTNGVKHSTAGSSAVTISVSQDQAGALIVVRNAGRLEPRAASQGAGIGLNLIRDLLPQPHADLQLRQDGSMVEARLVIGGVLLGTRASVDAARSV